MKFLFGVALICLSFELSAQGGSVTILKSSGEKETAINESRHQVSKSETSSGDVSVETLQEEKKAYQEQEIIQKGQNLSEGLDALAPEASASDILSQGSLKFGDLKNSALRHQLMRIISNNPLAVLPHETVKAIILKQVEGQPIEKLFLKVPVSLDIVVDFIRDQQAVKQLIKIFDRADDLKTTGLIALGLMIFLFIVRFKLTPKGAGLLKVMGIKFLFFVFYFVSVCTLFYVSYYEELSPSVRIIFNRLT